MRLRALRLYRHTHDVSVRAIGREDGVSWFSWAGGHDEPWRRLIKNVPVEALDEDSGELVEIKPKQDNPNDVEGLLIRFDYTDAGGNRSRRVLLCRRCWETVSVIYVQGFCTLRQALRTFRVDHMRAVEDVRGKRKISNPAAFFFHFAEHEDAVPPPLPRAPIQSFDVDQWTVERQRVQRAREVCIDGLRVLGFLALADDLVTDQERSIEESYIRSRLTMCGLPLDSVGNMMDVARTLTVPSRSFTRALSAIAKDKEHLNLVVAAAARMAQSTKKLNVIERGALNQILDIAKSTIGKAQG